MNGPANYDLPGQFILCKSKGYVPKDWITRERGSWLLACHPSLPVTKILGSDSSELGWLLGCPISPEGQLLTGKMHLPVSPNDSDAPSQFESSIYAFGGRFATVFLNAQASRLYLDPCGSLSAVFCPKQQIVASSLALIPYSEGCEDNSNLIRALGFPDNDPWYPFRLTPRHAVERLLPNHFLELVTWEPVRHWPTGDMAANQDIQRSVLEIASILRNQFAAIARDYPIEMTLTAGRDTRMLLACAREQLERIKLFTIAIPDAQGMLDCRIARQIAKRFGLNHAILRFEQATETELNEWLYRTGYCVAGRTWRAVRVFKRLDNQSAFLSGMYGGVRHLAYSRDGDTESSLISASDVLKRIHMPAIPDIEDRARQWLEGLSFLSTLTVLDLLLIEQRYGCWAGPQQYGHISSACRLFPFSHRRIFEIILGLPCDYRRRQLLPVDLIRSQWPELLHFPFNEPIGFGRYARVVRGAAQSIPRWMIDLIKGRLNL